MKIRNWALAAGGAALVTALIVGVHDSDVGRADTKSPGEGRATEPRRPDGEVTMSS